MIVDRVFGHTAHRFLDRSHHITPTESHDRNTMKNMSIKSPRRRCVCLQFRQPHPTCLQRRALAHQLRCSSHERHIALELGAQNTSSGDPLLRNGQRQNVTFERLMCLRRKSHLRCHLSFNIQIMMSPESDMQEKMHRKINTVPNVKLISKQ